MTRPVYTREFKDAAVARVVAGEEQREVADDLGIPRTSVGRWCRESTDFLTSGRYAPRETPEEAAKKLEEREEARGMAEDGVVLWKIIDTFAHRDHRIVRAWLSDIDCDRSRRPEDRNGRPDDGIIDEVAIARALRFDPAAIEVLRTTEYREFCIVVGERSRLGRMHAYPAHESWLALPKWQREEITNLGQITVTRRTTRTERLSA